MVGGLILRTARRRAGLSQRQLAERTHVPQPVIARIESGRVSPGVDNLDKLLAGCGAQLGLGPRLGVGVDRSVIRLLRKLTPGERARLAAEDARRNAAIA